MGDNSTMPSHYIDAPVSPNATVPRVHAESGALFVYTLAIAYASLNPFFGWRWPDAFTLFVWPRYFNSFDIVINVLAYAPLGGLLVETHLQKAAHTTGPLAATRIWWRAVVAGASLSAALEMLQAFLPLRVSSPIDLLTNTAGTAIGAGLLASAWGRALVAHVMVWRDRHFAPLRETGWGLLLLAAWFFAQLNPVIPFFEAGHIANPFDAAAAQNPYDLLVLLPHAVGVALNVCGFALFASLLLRTASRVMLRVLAILAVGLALKVSMASLLLKAPQMAAWLAPATVIGLSSGLLLFAYFSAIGYRWRAFCTTLFIFAGGLMAKMTSFYGAFDEAVRLLHWPQGHIASFAGLTRWIHEVWPLVACLLTAWIFIRHRPTNRRAEGQ